MLVPPLTRREATYLLSPGAVPSSFRWEGPAVPRGYKLNRKPKGRLLREVRRKDSGGSGWVRLCVKQSILGGAAAAADSAEPVGYSVIETA